MPLTSPPKSIDPNSRDLPALKQACERRLSELLPQSDERDLVGLAMRDCSLAPGKRLRPLLLMVAAHDLGCTLPAVCDLACALEMVHSASLILDDMPCMDNAALRRGRPTTHRRFGEDVAILASVALLSHAFRIVASLDGVAAEDRATLSGELAAAIGTQGLVKGQYQDLRDGAAPRSAETIAQTNALKTSMLFGAAMEMAGIVAQADARTRGCLRAFADELGQAFQLYDDLKDGAGNDSAVTGKDVGLDAGKSTLVALLGVEGVRQRASLHVCRADALLADAYAERDGMRRFMHTLFPASGLTDASRAVKSSRGRRATGAPAGTTRVAAA
ncbi:polyprenyl synthetase family protein [Chitinasiproducens palmae]|uniref:Geranylgeranyl diphosphate synthase, type II n=1 Tax=Chitinasiproducens palmae TaxID=1770053 RepID=A0A1H2PNS5_9BURK|nr:polyprenyl synthetase family protein [Chitinasiproducens palmae]SDV48312.1 geranylgeranyl diphosphate synthase, type II [Chitinasiproducens palmae]